MRRLVFGDEAGVGRVLFVYFVLVVAAEMPNKARKVPYRSQTVLYSSQYYSMRDPKILQKVLVE